ncbi:hypothetical protein [uncultured Campylobacter sp.]|uniref:hypothetical protein n=1 Tax=uncultured Campylobacter sp. TaxID=218934 RepID=UPI00260DF228|nr:hypothetical protein [uncultured Campylobacter sp.]
MTQEFCIKNLLAEFQRGILPRLKERVNFKFSRFRARRKILKQRASVTQNLPFNGAV